LADRRLYGEVVSARALAPALVERLYALHAEHYDGTDSARFRADLAEKEWVILLREAATDAPVGFSTQRVMDVRVDGKPVRALFSGDTIIHRDYWGSQELVRAWCRFAGLLKSRCGDRPLYWFLISKGYRTYLYLPLFFHEFYPRHDRPTPAFEQRLITALGQTKYPAEFDPETGLIEVAGPHDRLKPELDSSPARVRNPHVAFFLERNPRYSEGVELACVAEISPSNIRSTARRELEAGLVAGNDREIEKPQMNTDEHRWEASAGST
jgi:hypothetical protein